MSTHFSGTSITGDGFIGIAGDTKKVVPPGALYPNAIGDEAALDFAPLIDRYGDEDDALSVYLHALATMLKQTDDMAKDGPDGEPGWSQVFDLSRAKTEWLPWIGQLVGYAVPRQADGQTLEEYDSIQRERIITRSKYRRGTAAMLADALDEHLGFNRRVIVKERFGGDPWLIKIWVWEEDITTSVAEITKAALSQKLAGLLMEFSVLTSDGTYDTLRASTDDYADVRSTHPTYESVLLHPEL